MNVLGLGWRRLQLIKNAVVLLFAVCFSCRSVKSLVKNQTRVIKMGQVLLNALSPDNATMQKVVQEMPYQPFGVPGITDTTRFNENLAQSMQQAEEFWNSTTNKGLNSVVVSIPVTCEDTDCEQ